MRVLEVSMPGEPPPVTAGAMVRNLLIKLQTMLSPRIVAKWLAVQLAQRIANTVHHMRLLHTHISKHDHSDLDGRTEASEVAPEGVLHLGQPTHCVLEIVWLQHVPRVGERRVTCARGSAPPW